MTNNEEVLSQEAADATAGNHHEPTTDSALQPSHGGGPATAEGKLVSSQNARKHSFYAKTLFRPDQVGGEEHQAFIQLLARLTTQFQPCGVLEELLLEKIATESIRLRRLLEFENNEFAREHAWVKQGVDKVLRYQAAINRQFFQACAQLERLQRMRSGDHVPAPLSVDLRSDAAGLDIMDPLEEQETIPGGMLRAIAPAARFLSAGTTDVVEAEECTDVEGLASTEETAQ